MKRQNDEPHAFWKDLYNDPNLDGRPFRKENVRFVLLRVI